jgi:MFS family permease
MCRTPLLPLLARELGASPALVGLVVGASTVTGILLKMPAGAWSDVLGRRPLLILGTLVFAVMPWTYIGVASLAVLIALRTVHGAATAIFGPVASASLSDFAPAERRGTWLSTYATVQGAGQALGPVIAGYVLARGGYDLSFLVAGLIASAAPLLAAGWPQFGPPAPSTSGPRRSQFVHGIVQVCREPLILITSVAQAAQFVLNGTLNAFLPLFAHDLLGLTTSQVGWLFALQMITVLVTKPLIGMLSDRVGRRGVIVAGLILCGAAVVVISFAVTLPHVITGVLLYGVGVAVTTASTGAFITDVADRARYGAAHGVFGTIFDVGDALGPIVAGVLVATVGYAAMFRVMASVTLAAAAAFFVMSRTTNEELRTKN